MAECPKRRKYRDNPYTLNYYEEKNLYIVIFNDATGKVNKLEVSEEIYNALDRFELDDVKEMNEYDRHIEHSEIYEENLCVRAMDKPVELEDYIIQKSTFEDLKNAIDLLSEVQKRRIKLYYFDELNLEQIAKIEHTSFQMISKSIKQAINNLKKIFTKNKHHYFPTHCHFSNFSISSVSAVCRKYQLENQFDINNIKRQISKNYKK